METLSHFKNRRKSQPLRPSLSVIWLTFLLFLTILSCSLFLARHHLQSTFQEISQAPFDPQSPSPLAFIPFHPDRFYLSDPLTQAAAPANRLERHVSQYRKLSPSDDLLLLPLAGETQDQKRQHHIEQILSSKIFAPEFYQDSFYKIASNDMGLTHFVLRNDLIDIPPSPFQRWVSIAPHTLFFGTSPDKPKEGQYQIEYYAYVIPKLIILGSIDRTGQIAPRKVFIDDPSLAPPQQQLLTQIKQFKTSMISLNIILLIVIFLIALRENWHPTSSRDRIEKLLKYSQYDLLLSPCILLIPQTQNGAMVFCLSFMIYGTFKIFLNKALRLIQAKRIDLYR